MNNGYKIESGKLVIFDLATNDVKWSGDFEGSVFKILPIPEGDDCLVLLDPGISKKPTFENLLRVQPSGDITWRAKLSRSHDAYTDVLSTGEGVEARTWNGVRVLIDLADGSVREIGFSK